ncbi:2-polyprenyl-3-methyl-5-hydroxy-6-metoxy-1,4-benzoquinol methylase [Luteibacter rhizovicinus]|uniref:2-polyprenyl-3-methyl-5-hydroxy-6-metoxy-1, 4-benzoquinol methylase n=1 Tax=Luteibacter rhizovicinus TaxID=242606 RepID=A0A4R3YUS3_9GAMM|nr:class I SAM-dependent methyltransferase [Luteibacter rhizovicinus]TCV94963.1 2-polyprenyl-3-methyl-5-hydroxy-6-metoxy-1,4-benzoquinol methylase [Luteibacter rhizovicinus]
MAKKQPKLVLRESCIADVTKGWAAGSFFEAGAGTGHMSRIFLDRGFHGASHDLGESSRQAIRDNLAPYGERMTVVDSVDELADASFDYLLAFEVLEHIENDAEVLASWAGKLRHGGRILISVPAHARKYGRSDAMVGHVRRYERAEMQRLLAGAGFDDIQIINYGYPVTELTRRVSNRMIKGAGDFDGLSAEERSVRSAQVKPKIIERMLKIVGGNVFVPFCWIQRLFYRYDLGDGLVASAVRR